jgi:putative ABC transport system permease protein
MFRLVLRNILRRPLRNALTIAGVAISIGLLLSLLAAGAGYRLNLSKELDRSGVQLMVVPLGCPYDAAARILKNNSLEVSLPMGALNQVRSDPAVAVAAPMLMVAVPRPKEGRTDLWVGIDEMAMKLKPWWKAKGGASWFAEEDSVILGSEAAAVEMRQPGDKLFSPEANRTVRVAGILERSGTSDDSVFFVPLATAQKMFQQDGRLTGIAIQLRDPGLLRATVERLQKIPGAQVVTMTEMMGTFLNLLGAVRSLVMAIAIIAITVSSLTVFNTLLAGVLERTNELAVLRAIGASRSHIFGMLIMEASLLTGIGAFAGFGVAMAFTPAAEYLIRRVIPLAGDQPLTVITPALVVGCAGIALVGGLLSSLYPGWRAMRLSPAQATRGV